MNTRLEKNTIYNTIKTVFGVIYPLIAFTYISRVLLPDNVGKINFGNSVVSYFSLIASLGISTYAIRECAKVRDDRNKLSKLASQLFSINIIATVIAYLALAITFVFANKINNYRLLICIQSSAILFTSLGADWLNTAMEDFKFISIRTVGMQIISLILMFIFIHEPDDYINYAIISVISTSGANIVNIFYRRKFCKIKFTFNINLKKHFIPIALMLSTVISQTIYTNSDITILGILKSDYEVGLYSTSVKIYNLVNAVVASIGVVVMPQIAEHFQNKNYDKINEFVKYALNFIIILGIPALVGINVLAKPILYTVGGEEYTKASISLHILTLSLLCSFIGGWIGNTMMFPFGKEKICSIQSAFSAVTNIVLNFILIPRFGINAAAFTTFLSEFTGTVILIPFIDKNVKINGFSKMIKAPIVGSLFIAIIAFLINNFFTSEILITLISVISGIIIYTFILYILKDNFLLSILNKLKRKHE